MKRLFKNRYIVIGSFVVLLTLLVFAFTKDNTTPISLVEYNNFLETNNIQSAKILGDEVVLRVEGKEYSLPKVGVDVAGLLLHVPVEIEQKNSDEVLFYLMVIFAIWAMFLFVQRSYQAKKLFTQYEPTKAKNEDISAPKEIDCVTSTVTFDDVAGIQSAKDELFEVVEFLKHPAKYKEFGIKVPKGVLLVGPPGVGKTMVAKAVAGEAGVPFFYQSGSAFVEIYVGVGAKRVRELFSRAKANAPAIVFIDEIDSIGKARGGQSNDEREATLNQLLTQIDGFEDNSGVIIIGATNKIEMMDEALLRSGRFDRRVHLSLPDIEDRKKIVERYLRDKKHSVNLQNLAKMSVGFSGAALSTLVNEAAINALKRGVHVIEDSDFEAVRQKVLFGTHKILSFSDEEKRVQAYYQASKALCAYWFEVEFDKFGLIGDGVKNIEREIESKTQILSKIKICLSGSVGSKIFFNESYSNAKDDLIQASKLAHIMLYEYGMGQFGDDVETILQECRVEVEEFLQGMRGVVEALKVELLESESIDRQTIREIVFKGEK